MSVCSFCGDKVNSGNSLSCRECGSTRCFICNGIHYGTCDCEMSKEKNEEFSKYKISSDCYKTNVQ